MRTFMSLVGTKTLTTKEQREIAIRGIEYLGAKDIDDARFTYNNLDNFSAVYGTSISAVNLDSVTVGISTVINATEDIVDVTLEVPVNVKSTFWIGQKDQNLSVKPIMLQGKVNKVIVNGEDVKLDKKTAEKIARDLKNKKRFDKAVTVFVTKTCNTTADELFNKPETKKVYARLEKNYQDAVEDRLKKENKAKYEAIEKIKKTEKTEADYIALGANGAYIVFSQKGNDLEEASRILSSFDTEVWAIDSGHRQAEDANKKLISRMSKVGAGTLIYVTGPNRHEMRISI